MYLTSPLTRLNRVAQTIMTIWSTRQIDLMTKQRKESMTMTDVIRKIIAKFQYDVDTTPQLLTQMEGMAERNAKRIEVIKNEMGEKWILHPSHMKSRLDEPRPV